MRLLRANALEAVNSSRFNTKTPLHGVKSVLTSPLWIQVYVSILNRTIVNRYIDNIPIIPFRIGVSIETRYCNRITYDILLIFPQLFDIFKHQILWGLCRSGALHDLLKIHDRFEWSHDDIRVYNWAFKCACERGHLDVAQWLYTVFQLTVNDARDSYVFRNTCHNGHLHVAKWLYTTFHLTVDDVRIQNIGEFPLGRQDVRDWLIATFGLTVRRR